MNQQLSVYTVAQLANLYEHERLILRSVDMRHTRRIRTYIMDQFMNNDVFIPPFVGSKNDDILYIIDGSSRLKAILEMFPLIERMQLSEDPQVQKKGIILDMTLANVELSFQVFSNFTVEERDQLFIDLNTKGKKVALSKRIAYDSRNMINIVTNELLQQHTALALAGIEQEKVSLNRPANKNFLSLSHLRAIVSLFLVGKETDHTIHTNPVDPKLIDERMPLLTVWLEELFKLESPDKIGNYHMSILANFMFVRALAYYALAGETRITKTQKVDYIRERMQSLTHISWETKQPLWERFAGTYRGKEQLYFVNKDKKTLEAIIEWLCIEGGEGHVKK